MKFSFYNRLHPSLKKVYNKSDAISKLPIEKPERFLKLMQALNQGLSNNNQKYTEAVCQKIVTHLCHLFNVPGVHVKVLEKRPSNLNGELHGLYQFQKGKSAMISVWMKTAKRKDVVSFKTFLRTLLHEVGHHLDYTYLHLADSLHTKGFYQRESHLLKQLMPKSLDSQH